MRKLGAIAIVIGTAAVCGSAFFAISARSTLATPEEDLIAQLKDFQARHGAAQSTEERLEIKRLAEPAFRALLRQLHDCNGPSTGDADHPNTGWDVSDVIEASSHDDACPYRVTLREAQVR